VVELGAGDLDLGVADLFGILAQTPCVCAAARIVEVALPGPDQVLEGGDPLLRLDRELDVDPRQ